MDFNENWNLESTINAVWNGSLYETFAHDLKYRYHKKPIEIFYDYKEK
jgi:hypothetical protein